MPGSQDAASSASGSETAEVATAPATPAAPPWGKPQGVGVTKGETLRKMAENTPPQVERMEPENDGFPKFGISFARDGFLIFRFQVKLREGT